MSWTLAIVAAVVAGVVGGSILVLRWRRRSPTDSRAAPGPKTSPAATLRASLTTTRRGLLPRLQNAWGSGKDTEGRLADLEEILLTADVGVKTTRELLARLRPRALA